MGFTAVLEVEGFSSLVDASETERFRWFVNNLKKDVHEAVQDLTELINHLLSRTLYLADRSLGLSSSAVTMFCRNLFPLQGRAPIREIKVRLTSCYLMTV